MSYPAIIQIAADALGISPQARAAERDRQMQYYNQALDAQSRGLSLKEAGFDPKVVENTLGPDYAAHLLGVEKTDAFRQAVQARQFNDQLKSAAQQFISAPATQTIEGITPEEAAGFFPRISGEGVSPVSEIATANLTRPGFEQMQQRIESIRPQTAALLYGAPVAAQGTAGRTLEQVAIPGVGLEAERTNIAGRQAGVAEASQALAEQQQAFTEQQTRVENVRKKRQSRITALANAQRVVAVTHPQLTGAQARKLAKYYAEQGTGAGVTDIPGLVRTAGGGGAGTLGAKAAYARLNTVADRIPNEVVPNAQKARRVPDQTELDGANDAALREFTLAAADYLAQSGIQPNPQSIALLAAERATFATRRGSKIVAVPWADLKPREREAKLAIIEQVMAGASRGTGAGKAYLDELFGGAPAAPAPAPAPAVTAPSAGPAPAPTPLSIVPGGGSVPGVQYPVVPSGGGMNLPAGAAGGVGTGAMPGARRFERLIPPR